MTTELQQQVKAWKNLKVLMEKVQDPCLKTAMLAEFRKRAINEWGFDPETSEPATEENIPFNEFEKKILERIKIYKEYGVDPYTKEEKEELDKVDKEFRLNMFNFVKSGGTLADMPDELKKSEYIREEYFKALYKVYDIE